MAVMPLSGNPALSAYRRLALAATAPAGPSLRVAGEPCKSAVPIVLQGTDWIDVFACDNKAASKMVIQLCKKHMLNGLLTLDFCASRCSLLQCGSDTAALLGRFLPRLRPLANASGLFFGWPAPDPEKWEPVSRRSLCSGRPKAG